MKKWLTFFSLSAAILQGSHGFSESIRLPDETITGETLRIEKSAVFTRPAPAFNVVFPELTIPAAETPDEETTAWNPEWTKEEMDGRSYFSLSAGTYDSISADFLYRNKNAHGTEYSLLLDNYVTSGSRENAEEQKNSVVLNWRKPDSGRFSLKFDYSVLGLPGRESAPTDAERDSFSFGTEYSYAGKSGFRPSLAQSFYSLADIEANFLLLDMQFGEKPVTLETMLERLDVFKEFSTTSLYQGLLVEKGRLTAGGGLKYIESHGARFLPMMRWSVNENLHIGLESIYRVPDLYRDVMFTNYKEFAEYDLAPEEQYTLSVVFNKNMKNTALNLELSQTWRENFYTWADADINDLLEPFQDQCWQTSVSMNLKQRLSRYVSFFFAGEKNFLSRRTDYYPEERFDTGITLFSSSIYCKFWLSYTGERIFSDVATGSDTTINVEMKMLFSKNMEWGIGVHNLADREYFEVPGYPAEGRRFVSYVKLLL